MALGTCIMNNGMCINEQASNPSQWRWILDCAAQDGEGCQPDNNNGNGGNSTCGGGCVNVNVACNCNCGGGGS